MIDVASAIQKLLKAIVVGRGRAWLPQFLVLGDEESQSLLHSREVDHRFQTTDRSSTHDMHYVFEDRMIQIVFTATPGIGLVPGFK